MPRPSHADCLDLALALDLLAASSIAGTSLSAALPVVAGACPDSTGSRLSELMRLVDLGLHGRTEQSDSGAGTMAGSRSSVRRPIRLPREADRVEQDYAEGLVELERIIRAATADGIPPAAALTELGRQLRASVAGDQLERARRCAVSTVAPLGLCFLPAFVLVAVAPVVMAAFQQMNG